MTLEQFISEAVRRPTPFYDRGRSFDGWDCYGMVALAYHSVARRTIPDFAYATSNDVKRVAEIFLRDIKPFWQQVSTPEPLDVICLYRKNLPIHAALYIGRREMLHVEQGVDTCIEPVKRFRIEGYYRPL